MPTSYIYNPAPLSKNNMGLLSNKRSFRDLESDYLSHHEHKQSIVLPSISELVLNTIPQYQEIAQQRNYSYGSNQDNIRYGSVSSTSSYSSTASSPLQTNSTPIFSLPTPSPFSTAPQAQFGPHPLSYGIPVQPVPIVTHQIPHNVFFVEGIISAGQPSPTSTFSLIEYNNYPNMLPDSKKPITLSPVIEESHPQFAARQIKRRTRTGCLTCRKRRVKCDERKPGCKNCERTNVHCLGYQNKPTKIQLKNTQKSQKDHYKNKIILDI